MPAANPRLIVEIRGQAARPTNRAYRARGSVPFPFRLPPARTLGVDGPDVTCCGILNLRPDGRKFAVGLGLA